MREKAYILLGSDLGDRLQLLNKAVEMIENSCGQVFKQSKVYESKPWGFESGTLFLNQVIGISTDLSPKALINNLLNIEKILGRKRINGGHASRSIDLDILYYGAMTVQETELEIPHPRLHLRRFTLVPLAEIAADHIHPVLLKSNKQLLESIVDNSDVKPYHTTAACE